MEDRKRPAAGAVDDVAPPPSKRQAVNGSSGRSKDDSSDPKEEAWIEEYTKGAIYRQMNEYKREKMNLEARLQQIEKKSVDHDDHIRIVDAWLLQFLQEIELLADGSVSSSGAASGFPIASGLFFKDSKDFQRHLGDKEKALSARIESIFKRLAAARGEVKPDVMQLEYQIKRLLASQKELGTKIERIEAENASLSEQCDSATLKVIKAERKLDRARSAQVQKMEQKALATATTRASSADNSDDSKEVNTNTRDLQVRYEEVQAVMAKQKEQLQSVLFEVKGLQDENTSYRVRKESITDDDYVRTEVFKQFKNANEDLIRRINNLEAINKQLREEAEKYQAERAAYRAQLESEAQAVASELEDQIQQKDQDLTRIRSARDELTADLSMRKACQDQEKKATGHIQELLAAKSGRITQLEDELERLRPSEDTPMTEAGEDLEALSPQELRQRLAKLVKLEQDYNAVNKELALIGDMYKKAIGLAHAKVLDFQALEERVVILTAEKSKADQKYFAARKDMDIRTAEVRTLRAQNGRSSEIISQLKDVEAHTRQLVGALEKEVANLRQTNVTLCTESKKLESQSLEATRRADLVKAQVSDLTNLIKTKDAANVAIKEQAMGFETEVERLKVQVRELTSDCNKWREKCRKNSSEEEEVLRNLVLCSVCRSNFKNTILKGCGHVFCNKCVEDRIANRMRKCPSCNKAFDRSDAMPAHL